MLTTLPAQSSSPSSKYYELENDIKIIQNEIQKEKKKKKTDQNKIDELINLLSQKTFNLSKTKIHNPQNISDPIAIRKYAMTHIFDAIEMSLLYLICNSEEIKDIAENLNFIPKTRNQLINKAPNELTNFVLQFFNMNELEISYNWVTIPDTLPMSFQLCCQLCNINPNALRSKFIKKCVNNNTTDSFNDLIKAYHTLHKYNLYDDQVKQQILQEESNCLCEFSEFQKNANAEMV